ncbi:MAG: hypothetical protein AAGG81_05475, partial [Chlamydiota bacterium]
MPVGFEAATERVRDEEVEEHLELSRRDPTCWKNIDNGDIHVRTYQHCIHIPEGHRANVFMKTRQDMQRIHEIVHYLSAASYYRTEGCAMDVLRENMYIPSDGDDICIAAALLKPDVAEKFWLKSRMDLMHQGYCIIPDMFSCRHYQQLKIDMKEVCGVDCSSDWHEAIRAYYENMFKESISIISGGTGDKVEA